MKSLKNPNGSFWQYQNGKSNISVIFGGIIILVALFFVQEMLMWGHLSNLIANVSIASTLYLAVAGSTMVYMFQDNKEADSTTTNNISPLITANTKTSKYRNSRGSFWQYQNGKSSAPMIFGIIIIIVSLIFVQEILFWGKDNLIEAAGAAATLFISITGSAMVYMYQDNKQANKTISTVTTDTTESTT